MTALRNSSGTVLTVGGSPMAATGHATPPLTGTWHTFLLTSGVSASSGITYSINRPAKYRGNPVFGSSSWTWDRDINYIGVMTDTAWPTASRYRLLYNALTNTSPLHQYTCYAYSNDGVSWTRPNEGLYTFSGSTNNNIITPVDAPQYAHGLYNPGGGSGQTYLIVTDTPGVSGPFNNRIQGATLPGGPYSQIATLGNDANRDFHGLVQRSDGLWVGYYQNGYASDSRVIGAWLSSSSNLATCTWSDQGTIISNGGSTDQRYGIHPLLDGDWIYGYVIRYNSSTNRFFAIALYISPASDGLTWTLADALFLSASSTSTDWDYGMIWDGAPTQVGTTWRHYYSACISLHNATPPYSAYMGYAVSGFQRIGPVIGAGGTLTTTAFTPRTGHLYVNTTASGVGARLDAEVLDAVSGLALTGYAIGQSDGLTTDTYSSEMTWGSGARTLPTGSSVKVRFTLTGAAVLYAYQYT